MALAAWFLGSAIGAATSSTELHRFAFTQPEMGVPFRVVLYTHWASEAEAAAQAAFSRIEQLNGILSDYEDESELSRLSQTAGSGQAVPVSPDLWRVLARAQEIARESDGAFDVTVGPVVGLWRYARRTKRMPNPDRLAKALQAVGYRKLELDAAHRTALLQVPRMRLDVGGLAKGYALQEAMKVLKRRGVKRALIAGGGDMVAGDPPPGEPGWRIEVAPLDVTNAPPRTFVLLRDRALATSGDLFQHVVINGVRYSHIVNPRTGLGLTDHSLVTVIARDGMTADALATAVSVLGPDRGLKLVKRNGAVAHIVRMPHGKLQFRVSRGFARYVDHRSLPESSKGRSRHSGN